MALKNKDKYPYLLKLYKEKYFENEINKDLVENFWNNENSIPKEYLVLFGDKYER